MFKIACHINLYLCQIFDFALLLDENSFQLMFNKIS